MFLSGSGWDNKGASQRHDLCLFWSFWFRCKRAVLFNGFFNCSFLSSSFWLAGMLAPVGANHCRDDMTDGKCRSSRLNLRGLISTTKPVAPHPHAHIRTHRHSSTALGECPVFGLSMSYLCLLYLQRLPITGVRDGKREDYHGLGKETRGVACRSCLAVIPLSLEETGP